MRDDPAPATAMTEDHQPGVTATLSLWLVLIWVTFGVWFLSYTGTGGANGEGSALRPLGVVAALAGTILALPARKTIARLGVLPVSIIAALSWSWLSLAWAIDPNVAIRRLVLATIIVYTVFLLASELGYRKSLSIVRTFFVVTLIASYISVIAFPNIGIAIAVSYLDGDEFGLWKGFFIHKNATGPFCAIMALTFLFDRTGYGRPAQALAVGASMFFLYMTGSKTSLAICLLAAAIGWASLYYRPADHRRYLRITALAALGLVCFVWFRFGADFFTETLKDPGAFTGRTQIWNAMLPFIQDNWVLGSGYGSYWAIGPASPILSYLTVHTQWVKTVSQGHNGYFDIVAQIGVVGLILVTLATFFIPMYKIFMSDTVTAQSRALIVSVTIFIFGNNMMESTIWDRDSFPQVMLMLVVCWGGLVCARPANAR